MKKKTTEERLTDILLEIYQSQSIYDDGTVDIVHLKEDVYKLKSLIADIIREMIGEKSECRKANPEGEFEKGFDYGYDTKEQEIRQRAKELGIELKKEK